MTLVFRRRTQIFLLTYLLTYSGWHIGLMFLRVLVPAYLAVVPNDGPLNGFDVYLLVEVSRSTVSMTRRSGPLNTAALPLETTPHL